MRLAETRRRLQRGGVTAQSHADRDQPLELAPGLTVVSAIAALSVLIAEVTSKSSPLVWAIAIGIVAGIAARRAPRLTPGVDFAARDLLRAGVALLGFQVSLDQVAEVGARGLLIAAGTLTLTLIGTQWLGRRLRVARDVTTLVAVGTAICGASAIAAAASAMRMRGEAAGYSIAVITTFGSVAMLVLPLAGHWIGLDDREIGVWAGASVQEVGQVAVAGAAVSAAALETGTLVKLARVAMLAPALIGLRLGHRRATGAEATGGAPILPGFVAAFLVCMLLRAILPLSPELIDLLRWLSTATLTCGLAAIGLKIDLREVLARGWRGIALGGAASLVALGSSLLLILAIGT